jgi:hypothetical protein
MRGGENIQFIKLSPSRIMTSSEIKRTKSIAATRSLVIYHFFEADWMYVKNLAHFFLFGYSRDADFLIVIAGECSIDLPQQPNIQYLHTKNQNNDFGGYCEAIRHLGESVRDYDYVHFVNCSVRGPFLAQLCDKEWRSIFREKLTSGVGLVGTTINILSSDSDCIADYGGKYGHRERLSHVQTMAYAMPKATLDFLCDQHFYSNDVALSKGDVVRDYEIRLSQLVLENGWNIRCLLPEYENIDFRKPHRDINPRSAQGDPNLRHCYFGRTPHPYETLFIKTNRRLFSEPYLDRLAFSQLCRSDASAIWKDNRLICDYVAHLDASSRSTESVEFAEIMVPDLCQWLEEMMVQLPETRQQVKSLVARYPSG